MKYLLDTNVVSELRKVATPRADPRFVAWARTESAGHAISVITLFELELGVRRIERRDPHQGIRLRDWLETVRATFDGRILSLDADAATRAAAFHVPDPSPDRDAFIAATAQVHGLVVATRNVSDFDGFGVPLFNPWEE